MRDSSSAHPLQEFPTASQKEDEEFPLYTRRKAVLSLLYVLLVAIIIS